MIRLEPGNTKFLRIDPIEVERNVHRGAKQAPIVHVVEVVGEREVQHIGYQVVTEGPVRLTYEQARYAGYDGRDGFHAAFSTTGLVLIAETRDEVLSLEKPAAPAKTTTKKEAKPRGE